MLMTCLLTILRYDDVSLRMHFLIYVTLSETFLSINAFTSVMIIDAADS